MTTRRNIVKDCSRSNRFGQPSRPARDKPALTNLLVMMSVLSDKSIEELEAKYAGKGYGVFKEDLADIVVHTVKPLQQHITSS